MKFLNRLTGRTIDRLPKESQIHLGEYLVQPDPGLTLNGQPLNRPTPLVPTVDGKIVLKDHHSSIILTMEPQLLFQEFGPSNAFRTIGAKLDAAETWDEVQSVVPVISDIEGRLELTEFEKRLQKWLFHIEAICFSPASKLTRIQEKTAVSRAKRIPTKAIDYLAGHSEDWLRRKYKSVEPRAILAEFIEETIDFYENQVTLRLITRLLRYLQNRIEGELERMISYMGRLEEIINRHQQSGNSYWYPKLHRNFKLAGEAYSGNLEQQQKISRSTLSILRELRQRLLKLMNSGFATEVSKQVQIAPVLRMTNKFAEDQHYKFVASIWEMLSKEQKEKSPEEIQCDRIQALADFTQFCGLMICRALEWLRFSVANLGEGFVVFNEKPQDFVHPKFPPVSLFCNREGVWKLVVGSERSIKFVPVAEQVHLSPCWDDNDYKTIENLNILYLYSPKHIGNEKRQVMPKLSIGKPSTPAYIPVSPEDFDSVERIGRTILWHMVENAWSEFPVQLNAKHRDSVCEVMKAMNVDDTLQDESTLVLSNAPIGIENVVRKYIESRKVKLRSLGKHQEPELKIWDGIEQNFYEVIEKVRKFPFCPLCGEEVLDFEPRDKGDFRFECKRCNIKVERRKGIPIIFHSRLEVILEGYGDNSKINYEHWLDSMFGMDLLAVPELNASQKVEFKH